MVSSSVSTKVPGPSSKLDRQWMRTPWLRAYSTERSCSTPRARGRHLEHLLERDDAAACARPGTMRGSALNTPGDVGVDLAHVGAQRRRQRHRGGVRAAAAERRHVERVRARRPGSRPRARSCPSSSASRMRSARTSRMRALVCEVSVTMPACEPVSEIASWPRSLITIAASAHEIALAGREQHVHLARMRARRRPRGPSRSARRWSCRARTARPPRVAGLLARATMRRGGALDALGVGHGGAAELHDDGLGAGAGSAWRAKDSFRAPRAARACAPAPWSADAACCHRGRRWPSAVAARARDSTLVARVQLPAASATARRAGASLLPRRDVVPPAARAGSGPPGAAAASPSWRSACPLERKVAQLFLLGFEGTDLTRRSSSDCAARPRRPGVRVPQLPVAAAAARSCPARARCRGRQRRTCRPA